MTIRRITDGDGESQGGGALVSVFRKPSAAGSWIKWLCASPLHYDEPLAPICGDRSHAL